MKQNLLSWVAGLSVVLGASTAMAQTACEVYIIKPGDTLRGINIRAYGNDNFRPLFELNRGVIGSDPNFIEVGSVLEMPCDRNEAAAAPATAPTPAPTPVVEPPAPVVAEPAAPVVVAPPPVAAPEPDPVVASSPADSEPALDVRFVTYDGNAPYSGSDLPNGGLATELLETAYTNMVPDAVVNVTIARDLPGFLRAMGGETYDVGFPSIRPNCNVIETLAVEMIELCAKYAFSEPFHEIQMTGWTLSGSSLGGVTDPSDLSAARICRPQGLFTFDLDADRLPGRRGALSSPATATDCFEALANGETDVVSIPRGDARGAIAAAGLSDRLQTVPALERGVTLHAVANQANAEGVAAIARLNRGLQAMRSDGTWFSIVSRQLSGG